MASPTSDRGLVSEPGEQAASRRVSGPEIAKEPFLPATGLRNLLGNGTAQPCRTGLGSACSASTEISSCFASTRSAFALDVRFESDNRARRAPVTQTWRMEARHETITRTNRQQIDPTTMHLDARRPQRDSSLDAGPQFDIRLVAPEMDCNPVGHRRAESDDRGRETNSAPDYHIGTAAPAHP